MPRGRAPDEPEAPDPGVKAEEPGDMMLVEEEVVRDLRHSVGNHFHKLYYWADRLGSDDAADEWDESVAGLNGALQRFQSFLETGLKYFEKGSAEICEMSIPDVSSASASLLAGELPGVEVAVGVSDEMAGHRIRLDPQRFSYGLRLVLQSLGAAVRARVGCHFAAGGEDGTVDLSIEVSGGEAPLEIPVMEWAIARKAIAMQGGRLWRSPDQRDEVGGCTITLPLGT